MSIGSGIAIAAMWIATGAGVVVHGDAAIPMVLPGVVGTAVIALLG